jgi:hypothetical protein
MSKEKKQNCKPLHTRFIFQKSLLKLCLSFSHIVCVHAYQDSVKLPVQHDNEKNKPIEVHVPRAPISPLGTFVDCVHTLRCPQKHVH